MKRITKKQSSKVRKFASEIFKILHKNLKDKYTFTVRLVGSVAWNTVLKDSNGFWDVDYQILLTKNSKEYKVNRLNNPTDIKSSFLREFNKIFKDDKNYKIENSTTAITLIDKKNKYSIDFVIIKLYPSNNEIIRRNNKKNSSINEFTWNQLPKFNEAYRKFSELCPMQKKDLIENYVLPRKKEEKKKHDNDKTKRSSSEILIEEINNYEIRE